MKCIENIHLAKIYIGFFVKTWLSKGVAVLWHQLSLRNFLWYIESKVVRYLMGNWPLRKNLLWNAIFILTGNPHQFLSILDFDSTVCTLLLLNSSMPWTLLWSFTSSLPPETLFTESIYEVLSTFSTALNSNDVIQTLPSASWNSKTGSKQDPFSYYVNTHCINCGLKWCH